MRFRVGWTGGLTLLAAALSAAVLGAACAGSKPSQRAGAGAGGSHPEVDTGLATCFGCHTQVTPTVAAQWKDGRHGLALVECFVCHGSTGADFRSRPSATGCGGCHPAQAAQAAPDGTAQGCFACHPAHALHAAGKASPHGSAGKGARP